MQPHDEVCLCFHVTRKKLESFIRLEHPRRAAQLSECFGAGTGCGWCRPVLQRLFDAAANAAADPVISTESAGSVDPAGFSPEEYARGRAEYRQAQRGESPVGS